MNPFETHGAISWHEYLAADIPLALNFYSELLGWTTSDMPTTDGEVYKLLHSGSKRVGGLMACPPGVPPCWTYYVTVSDIQKLLGENELDLIVPLQDTPVGPFAGFRDPQGASLFVIQYHDGNEEDEQTITSTQEAFLTHGAFAWFELQTADPKAAADWYSKLFGWTIDEQQMPGGNYWVISVGDTQIGGIMESVDPNVPSNWNSYVTVDDVDAIQAKAAELGATITAPAFDVPEVGRLLHISNPAGAALAFATWLPMPE
ncbi:MAG: VOC family protein [Rhodothermaceae bacterium]|nr:VOC family protein [Rhodothermaceae bacterium]